MPEIVIWELLIPDKRLFATCSWVLRVLLNRNQINSRSLECSKESG